nr:uncharacterized protein LOC128688735 [Cherax quadricarinatus]
MMFKVVVMVVAVVWMVHATEVNTADTTETPVTLAKETGEKLTVEAETGEPVTGTSETETPAEEPEEESKRDKRQFFPFYDPFYGGPAYWPPPYPGWRRQQFNGRLRSGMDLPDVVDTSSFLSSAPRADPYLYRPGWYPYYFQSRPPTPYYAPDFHYGQDCVYPFPHSHCRVTNTAWSSWEWKTGHTFWSSNTTWISSIWRAGDTFWTSNTTRISSIWRTRDTFRTSNTTCISSIWRTGNTFWTSNTTRISSIWRTGIPSGPATQPGSPAFGGQGIPSRPATQPGSPAFGDRGYLRDQQHNLDLQYL